MGRLTGTRVNTPALLVQLTYYKAGEAIGG
jgi:hypothetical protein